MLQGPFHHSEHCIPPGTAATAAATATTPASTPAAATAATPASTPAVAPAPGPTSSAVPVWEVMLGGRMRPYDDATARLLEATLANGQDSAQVVAANGESYLVIGLQSGSDYHQHPVGDPTKTRRVQRVPSQ